MPRAKVTSVEALESFRANLIVYLSKARPALEEVSDDVIRTRVWLESDRRVFWEREVRRRLQKLQDAQQALFSAEISALRAVSTAERMAIVKARRALDEAEEKLKIVKRWIRDFGNQVEPLAKKMEKLDTVLVTSMPKAIAYLAQAVKTLDAYSDVVPTSAEAPQTSNATPAVEDNRSTIEQKTNEHD
jgi:hypothetical protein